MSKFIRLPEVKALTGFSRSTIFREEKANRFPKRIKLSRNIIAWDHNEVQAWAQSRLGSRN